MAASDSILARMAANRSSTSVSVSRNVCVRVLLSPFQHPADRFVSQRFPIFSSSSMFIFLLSSPLFNYFLPKIPAHPLHQGALFLVTKSSTMNQINLE
jgi:hypothetical protein